MKRLFHSLSFVSLIFDFSFLISASWLYGKIKNRKT